MIKNYFRYIDDILLILDSNHTNIQAILTDFNSIHPNLHFTAESGAKKKKYNKPSTNFHTKNCTQYKIDIYRKPSFTTLQSIQLKINMLQLHTYITD